MESRTEPWGEETGAESMLDLRDIEVPLSRLDGMDWALCEKLGVE